MVLKTFISGFSPSPILPGGSSHSVEMDCHPEMGVWKLAFQLEGEARAGGRMGSHSTHSALSVVDGSSGVLKITSFLPPCLAPARAPVVPLFHPYHTLSSPTFTLLVGSPPPLSPTFLLPLAPSESETSSLFPKFPPLPFHSVALSFRQVCCTSLQCSSRTAVSPPFFPPLALTNHDTFVLYFPQFFLPPPSLGLSSPPRSPSSFQ